VQDLGLRVSGEGIRVLRFRIKDLGLRDWSLGVRVKGFWMEAFRV
jgi:hypothetical protein